MKRLVPIVLVIGAAMLSGCFHYTAQVPGVLDLRSDGSTAAPNEAALAAPAPAKEGGEAAEPVAITRDGIGSLLEGDGVVEQGTQFTVEDRHWFLGATALLPGLFLVANESSTEELDAALGGEAVRNLRVGHRITLVDIILPIGIGIIPIVGGCMNAAVAPRPWTFTASGERILAEKSGAVAPPVPPPEEASPQPEDAAAPEAADAAGAEAPEPTADEPALAEEGDDK